MPNLSNMKNSIPNKDDELYTPKILVDIIVKYIPKDKTIWCGFDYPDSEFVLTLKENGFNVVHSHIDDGLDFFKYEPEQWDIFISNPPYSKKWKFWNGYIVLINHLQLF